MCAAPGGKSLVLAEKLNGTGTLICNEYSLNRRQRLIQVMQQYVPREVREKHIWVKGLDGMAYGMRDKGIYDSILLDAPCSGERHLLENPAELKKWSRNRTQKLSQKQYGLLTSALLALSSKGYLLYSTCSISPLENDGVIDHLIKKKSDTFNVVQIERPHELAEPTEHGWIFLPDRSGFGPLYFCLLQKN
jgi:16S rRNA C967 or C1407 C5-methylase (RsmB/RsmF family)